MTIYGGFYHEECIFPEWSQIYGSAGRAAAILSNFSDNITLNTFCTTTEYLEFFSNAYKINYIHNPSTTDITFKYFHTFSKPEIIYNSQIDLQKSSFIEIEDDIVICYGTLESDAPLIKAKYGIFDFQSSKLFELFSEKNSIENIAFILNYEEAKYISLKSTVEDIQKYFFSSVENLQILIIKDGPFGGYACTKSEVINLPVYRNKFIFKIGTGDIFTSIFGYFWAINEINKMPLTQIVDYASFSTAFYTENYKSQYKNSFLDFYEKKPYDRLLLNRKQFKNKVYLAGPFFNTSQRWQIEDSKVQLEKLGFDVFSPIHDVGIGETEDIAQKDLEGLDWADSVFAVLNGYDPGTVFEIGYAIAKGKRVVLFSEQKDEVNLTMFKGSGCLLYDDITTALYNLVWLVTSK